MPSDSIMNELSEKLEKARRLSRANFAKEITFFLPGMFRSNGVSGRYPAISITGEKCDLDCEHCRGSLLKTMIHASTPRELEQRCMILWERGYPGALISGGCDPGGRLPWPGFLESIRKIKRDTGLFLSVHSGIVDDSTASALADAGIDQALIDVMGDDETYRSIYHVPFGISRIVDSMESLQRAGIPLVPHIVCGIFFGRMGSEKQALEILKNFDLDQLVIVSYMKIPGTNAEAFALPAAEDVADLIAEARIMMPGVRMSLGCARQRGNTKIEEFAIEAGVNRMALPSDEAVAKAMEFGLEIRYQRTCCSVSRDFSSEKWDE